MPNIFSGVLSERMFIIMGYLILIGYFENKWTKAKYRNRQQNEVGSSQLLSLCKTGDNGFDFSNKHHQCLSFSFSKLVIRNIFRITSQSNRSYG